MKLVCTETNKASNMMHVYDIFKESLMITKTEVIIGCV